MNHFRFHIGDYMKDTSHLSLLEHGVYLRLIQVYYTRESPIPEDQAARLIGARSQDERDALSVVLKEFFQVVDGNCHQNRCQDEIDEWHRLSAEQAAKGRAGAQKRWNGAKNGNGHSPRVASVTVLHGTGHDPAIEKDGRSIASQLPTPNSQLPEGERAAPSKELAAGEERGAPRQNGSTGARLPEDFTLTVSRARFASELGLNPQTVFAHFTDYWRAVPGAKGRKSDWDATWRTWCRRDAERTPAKGGADNGLPFAN